jgi:hypothetical protein
VLIPQPANNVNNVALTSSHAFCPAARAREGGYERDVGMKRGSATPASAFRAPLAAEPTNFGFTDDVETHSSVIFARAGTGYYSYGRPRQSPALPAALVRSHDGVVSPFQDAVATALQFDVASPHVIDAQAPVTRSESPFTSVTDRMPGESATRQRIEALWADLHDYTGHRALQMPANTRSGPTIEPQPHMDSWCQTSERPEARSASEIAAAQAASRDEWLSDFKRRWQSVSTHYTRLINRAERVSPGRVRAKCESPLRNLSPVATVRPDVVAGKGVSVARVKHDAVSSSLHHLPPMYQRAEGSPVPHDPEDNMGDTLNEIRAAQRRLRMLDLSDAALEGVGFTQHLWPPNAYSVLPVSSSAVSGVGAAFYHASLA